MVNEKITRYNYSGIIPKIQYWKRIPSVYSDGEIAEILDSVNRSTVAGKRDYAILLLAARLGLRSCDIRFLCFENVNFEKKLIEFAQYKTGVPQRLTLLPEIAEALRDYIDNARGDSKEPFDIPDLPEKYAIADKSGYSQSCRREIFPRIRNSVR